MLLKDFVSEVRESLAGEYSEEETKALTGIVCEEFLGVKSYTHILEPGHEIKEKLLPPAREAVKRLAGGEPVQYILGRAEFYGRRFKVSPAVLIPRPETESLCKAAIDAAMMIYRNRSAYGKDAVPVRVLDLCTGSGCIAWTVALDVTDSRVTAVEISEEALSVARSQAFKAVAAPVFLKADIRDMDALDAVIGEDAQFDLILSNPPYVLESEKALMRRNVLEHEPALALFVEDADAMVFNEKIAEIAKKHLYTGGVGFVEINEALGERSVEIFRSAGFADSSVFKDMNGKARFVRFKRTAA